MGTNNRQRGATIVEFAVVFPILLLLILGTIELGLVFKDYLTVSYISREAARVGALAGNDAKADCAILKGIATVATPSDLARIDHIEIFRADTATGDQIASQTNTATYNGGDPNVCEIDGSADGWDLNSTPWPPTSRQVTIGDDDPDIIGVRVILHHNWVTGFPPFRGTVTIDESTITRLEPEAFE